MKRKIFTLAIISMLFGSYAHSQTIEDALRFSTQQTQGTARFTAMGGAFGALGGDFSSLSVNPAGVGVYRSNEFSISLDVASNHAKSTYQDYTYKDSRTRFGLPQLGFIATFNTGNSSGLVNFNMGFGYNKQSNFTSRTYTSSQSSNSSLMDYFENKANTKNDGYPPYYNWFNSGDMAFADNYNPFFGKDQYGNYLFGVDDWDVLLAYNNVLIDTMGGIDNEFFAHLGNSDRVRQQRTLKQEGNTGEYVISFGGNVSNQFYFGATLGIQDINYSRSAYYSENGIQGNVSDFSSFTYRQFFETNGTGVNIKLGAIYKPIDNLRIGAAFHSPTWLHLEDAYTADMVSRFTGDSQYYPPIETPINIFKYRLNTPMKFVGSAAYIFGGYGLLSVDYEYIDYPNMKMKDPDYPDTFRETNDQIGNAFRGTSNVRLGAEFVLQNLALRAGFGYYQNPVKSSSDDTYQYSLGIGYRTKNFFIDFAYSLAQSKNKFTYYESYGNVSEKNSMDRYILTVGFKF